MYWLPVELKSTGKLYNKKHVYKIERMLTSAAIKHIKFRSYRREHAYQLVVSLKFVLNFEKKNSLS